MVNRINPSDIDDDLANPTTERTIDEAEAGDKARRTIWYIVVILLILAALYSLLASNNDNAMNNDNAASNSSNSSSVDTATISDTNTLTTAATANDIVGKPVNITSTPVLEVIGDRSFTVGTTESNTYALLDENLNNGSTEQAIKVEAGKSYQITGTVTAVPSDMTTVMSTFGLTDAQATTLQQKGYYVAVNSIK